MNYLKPILWRLYLTAISLLLIAAVWSGGYFAFENYENKRSKKTLSNYLINKYRDDGSGWQDDKSDTSEKSKTPGKFPWEKYVAANERKLITDEQMFRLCLEDLLRKDDGSYIYECSKDIPTTDIFEATDLTTQSRIGGSLDFEFTRTCLVLLAVLIVLRYWICWAFLGQKPRSFP